jgi:Mlc titration factor MtfA (ptsG expression regulator)
MLYMVSIILLILGFGIIFRKSLFPFSRKKGAIMDDIDRMLLLEKVVFYAHLPEEQKKEFERRVQDFLANIRIRGVGTSVDRLDELYVGASAIIPIFKFKHWIYRDLKEVLLYPNAFNQQFETRGENRRILGMVGKGSLSGKMILSKRALRMGFSNQTDKKNTAIHEFLHLIDDADGSIDGFPYALKDTPVSLPWFDLMNRKIKEIEHNKTDINRYGATNNAEFFAVAGEYFFERPELLKRKHPELFRLLDRWFCPSK